MLPVLRHTVGHDANVSFGQSENLCFRSETYSHGAQPHATAHDRIHRLVSAGCFRPLTRETGNRMMTSRSSTILITPCAPETVMLTDDLAARVQRLSLPRTKAMRRHARRNLQPRRGPRLDPGVHLERLFSIFRTIRTRLRTQARLFVRNAGGQRTARTTVPRLT